MTSSKTLQEVLSSKQNSKSWVEKYRPKTITDVQHQDTIISSINTFVRLKNIPHFLFYGSPGTGKTSTILALITALKQTKCLDSVLELNASSERGINVVRGKIKNFAQQSCEGDKIKFIILDEADTMTTDAQTALRRCMEQYSKHTRFCLICNFVSKIIDPIISRCMIYRFKPIPTINMVSHLETIAKKEQFDISLTDLNSIVNFSNGDMRKAINSLEMAYYFMTDDNGLDVVINHIPECIIVQVWKTIISGSYNNLDQLLLSLINHGYDCRSLLESIVESSMKINLSDDNLATLILQISISENALIRGSSEYVELLNILQSLFNIKEKKQIINFISEHESN